MSEDTIDKKEFLKKIDRTAKDLQQNEELSLVERDTKIDLLLYLKANLSLVSSRTQLRESVITKILTKMEDEDISVGQLTKLLEVLDGAENDKMASILGVLKQQAVVQNNIQANGNSTPMGPDIKEIPINPEDFHTAKRVYQFLDKATKAEFPEMQKPPEE
jgi:hypothetical protein